MCVEDQPELRRILVLGRRLQPRAEIVAESASFGANQKMATLSLEFVEMSLEVLRYTEGTPFALVSLFWSTERESDVSDLESLPGLVILMNVMVWPLCQAKPQYPRTILSFVLNQTLESFSGFCLVLLFLGGTVDTKDS